MFVNKNRQGINKEMSRLLHDAQVHYPNDLSKQLELFDKRSDQEKFSAMVTLTQVYLLKNSKKTAQLDAEVLDVLFQCLLGLEKYLKPGLADRVYRYNIRKLEPLVQRIAAQI